MADFENVKAFFFTDVTEFSPKQLLSISVKLQSDNNSTQLFFSGKTASDIVFFMSGLKCDKDAINVCVIIHHIHVLSYKQQYALILPCTSFEHLNTAQLYSDKDSIKVRFIFRAGALNKGTRQMQDSTFEAPNRFKSDTTIDPLVTDPPTSEDVKTETRSEL